VNIIEVDPLGPKFGGAHVVKGSSWQSGTRSTLRPAYRDGLMDRRDDVGFRIGRYL
jgi:formylglycine-generating enzyme required for sulfatase activity